MRVGLFAANVGLYGAVAEWGAPSQALYAEDCHGALPWFAIVTVAGLLSDMQALQTVNVHQVVTTFLKVIISNNGRRAEHKIAAIKRTVMRDIGADNDDHLTGDWC